MAEILVIDDDPDFVLAVRMALEAHGFEVEEAATAEEGIEKVLSVQPDLVILDVMMPTGYEGFEAARAIREEHGLKDLPLVILTSLHGKRQVPYRFAPDETYLPVDVFLDKPIEPDALVDTINELLGERREEPKYPL
jgi:CheY-like chemotaxis protein